jgi:hypothetical protein
MAAAKQLLDTTLCLTFHAFVLTYRLQYALSVLQLCTFCEYLVAHSVNN